MKILAIGAHVADVFDCAGGTLANNVSAGDEVVLAVITHSAYSHAQVITSKNQAQHLSELKVLKKRECDEAAQHIGIKEVRYFDYDDEPFIMTREAVLELGEYIREVRPDIMVTHHCTEYNHHDHPVVGDMVLRSSKAAQRWIEGSEREPHTVKRTYFFGVQYRRDTTMRGDTVLAPNFAVDITESIEKKVKALAAFESQSFQGNYDEKWARERIEKIEGNWGFMNGVKYGEEFILLEAQVVKTLS
jgi:LmbE family N-acetylglucosaminyl deacetylase